MLNTCYRSSTAAVFNNIIYDMPDSKEIKMADCTAYAKTMSRPVPAQSSDEQNVYDTIEPVYDTAF